MSNSIDSAVSGGVNIIFGVVRAVFAAGGVIIFVGLGRVSRDSVFLVWGWMALVFSFVSLSGIIEVSVLVEVFAGFPASCCSVVDVLLVFQEYGLFPADHLKINNKNYNLKRFVLLSA